MRKWFIEAYGWDTTEEELQQGCQWRHDFMYHGFKYALAYTEHHTPIHAAMKLFVELNEMGLVPTC